ncbi:MAG: UrcA family protein [Parasphingopyxis sp.]|nr:UrcA family protein [Sphingomonadales bacterium]
MKNILISAAALVAASLSTVAAVSPGHAAGETGNRVAVSYADLNLSQAQDRRILDRRLAGAARTVCRAEHGYSPLTRRAVRDCQVEAVARASEQIPFALSATD